MALYHQTKAYESSRHLDVACGSGIGALIFTSMIKVPNKSGHLLVTSDIIPLMQEVMIKRFKDADFMTNQNNSFYSCAEEVNEKLSFPDEEKGVHIKSYLANNEKLRFASEDFHSYNANLSLMLVHNHINQLREGYRVLWKGGIAGFTVWGRRENCTFFTLIAKAIAQTGIEILKQASDPFYLGIDKKKLLMTHKRLD